MPRILKAGTSRGLGPALAPGVELAQDGQGPRLRRRAPFTVCQASGSRSRRAACSAATAAAFLQDPLEPAQLAQSFCHAAAGAAPAGAARRPARRPPARGDSGRTRPVVLLAVLGELDPQLRAGQRLQADLRQPQETRRDHGVEEAGEGEAEVALERGHVVVGAVQDLRDRGVGEDRRQGRRGRGRPGGRQERRLPAVGGELHEADLLHVVVEAVGLAVEGEGPRAREPRREGAELLRRPDPGGHARQYRSPRGRLRREAPSGSGSSPSGCPGDRPGSGPARRSAWATPAALAAARTPLKSTTPLPTSVKASALTLRSWYSFAVPFALSLGARGGRADRGRGSPSRGRARRC